MVANAVPAPERSRAVSFIFGGLHVGSILGLLACPWLIHNWGWQSVFFSFGASGLLWAAWFEWLRGSWQRHDPQFAALLQDYGPAVATQAAHSAEQAGRTRSAEAQPTGPAAAGLASQPIPYRAFLRSRPVQALGVTHFCHNFLHYTMLAWLPTYFTSTLAVDLAHAAQTALLPPLAGIIASATAGPLADWLISRGLPVPRVRKAIQGTSFLAPLALLLLACTEHVVHDRTASVACITAALGLSSFSLAGLYCTPQDLSPKYASALLSMSNTAGALPGVIGVTLVGMLYDATQSWQVALFMPSAVFMVIGAYAYCVHCRNTYIDFDNQDNSQFPVEGLFNRLTGRG
ncbi:major facilitator superfamily domain-containing protein [Haematococcus lacustris]